MRRKAAVFWHATLSVAAGVLYFCFVLPRWWELMGNTTHTLGTAVRIVAGVVIALAALPVVFTWLRDRKPEYGTPQLALTLQTCSIVAHVLAGVLIVGTAISEIWLNLDTVGQWLFGVYGAAAAIAVLGILRVLPVVCRRAAAAAAETDQAQERQAAASSPQEGRRSAEAEDTEDAQKAKPRTRTPTARLTKPPKPTATRRPRRRTGRRAREGHRGNRRRVDGRRIRVDGRRGARLAKTPT